MKNKSSRNIFYRDIEERIILPQISLFLAHLINYLYLCEKFKHTGIFKYMNKVRITAIRHTVYPDLIAQYENPIEHACYVRQGSIVNQYGRESLKCR